MSSKKMEWGKEILQTGSEISSVASEVGIPGIGLLGRFAQHFYDKHLQNRFEKFVSASEVDQKLIEDILSNEDYSNCFYASLETVRQTHSKIGVIALALIYKDHWNDPPFLINAMQAFSQISDSTLEAFLELCDEIPEGQAHLVLKKEINGQGVFHELYSEAVELIRRNFFLLSTGAGMHANGPIQGMKWHHTDSYYKYCKAAKDSFSEVAAVSV